MKMIKEAWTDMRNQPVIGIVTVIGTALAIFLIMIVTISAQVKTMPIAPESNRDRMLHAKFICLQFRQITCQHTLKHFKIKAITKIQPFGNLCVSKFLLNLGNLEVARIVHLVIKCNSRPDAKHSCNLHFGIFYSVGEI